MRRILGTGATGNIGREVVAQLSTTTNRVRAMTRRAGSAEFPEGVEVVRGDLTSDTLEDCLAGVDAVFLVWVAPIGDAPRALQRIAGPRTTRLSSWSIVKPATQLADRFQPPSKSTTTENAKGAEYFEFKT